MSRYLTFFVLAVLSLSVRLNVVRAASPASGLITFTSARDVAYDGNREIYIMNADGTAQTRLTNNPADDYASCLSPDGSKIVFLSDRENRGGLYIMNSDGTGQTRLLSGGNLAPSFSPDGAQIIFWGQYSDIFTIRTDGTGLRRLTQNINASQGGGAFNYRPVFSPDGSKIVFTSMRDGQDEIYVMNSDGTGLTRMTFSSADDRSPDWSPDGTKIVFYSWRDGRAQIYLMNADGSNSHRVSDGSFYDINPVFSSSGTRIAFCSQRGNWYQIYDMAIDGSDQRRLTLDTYESHENGLPSWSVGDIPVPVISATCAPVTEGDSGSSQLACTVSLSSVSSRTVTVNYATADNTAVASSDYQPRSGTLTFAPGETSKVVYIEVYGNFVDETDKSFFFDLSNPTESRIANPRNIATIIDDDSAGIRVSSSRLTTTEAGGQADFSVTLASQPTGDVAITLTSSNQREGRVVPASLVFTSGNWNTPQNVVVTGVDDNVVDGSQEYKITLAASNDDNAYRNVATSISAFNLDNDRPALTLSLSQNTILEGRSVNAALTRNSSTAKALAVSLFSSDRTEARAPVTVVIPAGQNRVLVPIEALQDGIVDGSKTVRMLATAAQHSSAFVNVIVGDRDQPTLVMNWDGVTGNGDVVEGPLGKRGTFVDFWLLRNTEGVANSPRITIRIAVSPSGQVIVPTTLTMPAGVTRMRFRVSAIDDSQVDGSGFVKIIASATGYKPATEEFLLRDNEAAFTIRGRLTVNPNVSGTTSTLPVSRYIIVLEADGRGVIDYALTDAAGYYQLDGVLPGTYRIGTQTLDVFPRQKEITLSGPYKVIEQNFLYTPRTSIRGTISTRGNDGTLTGVFGVTIQAKSAQRTYTARTDFTGAYRFDRLPLGVYTLLPMQSGQVFTPRSNVLKLTAAAPVTSDHNFILETGRREVTAPQASLPPVPASPLQLSTLSASQGLIRLTFTGMLDEDSASNAFVYRVSVNGVPLAIESVSVQGDVVVLGFVEDAFQEGDTIAVAYSGLRDKQSRLIQGLQTIQVR